jgi:hypothetical protein
MFPSIFQIPSGKSWLREAAAQETRQNRGETTTEKKKTQQLKTMEDLRDTNETKKNSRARKE